MEVWTGGNQKKHQEKPLCIENSNSVYSISNLSNLSLLTKTNDTNILRRRAFGDAIYQNNFDA